MNKGVFSLRISEHSFRRSKFMVRFLREFMTRQSGNWHFFITFVKINDKSGLQAEFIPSNLRESIPIQTEKNVFTSFDPNINPLIINSINNTNSSVVIDDNSRHPEIFFTLLINGIAIDFLEKWEIIKSIFQKYRTYIFAKILKRLECATKILFYP